MEPACNDSVVHVQVKTIRLGILAFDRSRKGDLRRLRAGNLTPVDAQVHALLGRVCGYGGLGGRNFDPRDVTRCIEGKGRRTACDNVDIAVAIWVVCVEGQRRVTAAESCGARILIVSRPGRCVTLKTRGIWEDERARQPCFLQ